MAEEYRDNSQIWPATSKMPKTKLKNHQKPKTNQGDEPNSTINC